MHARHARTMMHTDGCTRRSAELVEGGAVELGRLERHLPHELGLPRLARSLRRPGRLRSRTGVGTGVGVGTGMGTGMGTSNRMRMSCACASSCAAAC